MGCVSKAFGIKGQLSHQSGYYFAEELNNFNKQIDYVVWLMAVLQYDCLRGTIRTERQAPEETDLLVYRPK